MALGDTVPHQPQKWMVHPHLIQQLFVKNNYVIMDINISKMYYIKNDNIHNMYKKGQFFFVMPKEVRLIFYSFMIL